MLKTIARLEHKIGDRVYHLICDVDSPIHEVKESLFNFLGYAEHLEKASKDAAEKAKEEKPAEAVAPASVE